MFQGHGDDGYLHHQPLAADFSTNVYYGGAPDGLKEYLFGQWEKVQRYPEVMAESLTKKIATHYGFDNDQVLVTNGSTESIYLIAQAFKMKKTAIIVPAFAEYEDACRMFGHQITFIAWQLLHTALDGEYDLIYICNPNNPTGAVVPDLEQLIAQYPHLIFVVDEAFIEFTFAVKSLLKLTEKYSNLVVMRSMTKVYAIPGLRLGYIVAHPMLTRLFMANKLPWTVNTMALDAGHFIFDHFKRLQLPLSALLADKALFVEQISATTLTVLDSNTHFFIAETPFGTARDLKQFLLNHFNILIRDAANFRGLSERHLRIATLSPAKNNLLINALAEWKLI